jgi:hypothetical protein
VYPATAVTDLAAVDASVTAMEAQVQAIRRRLQEELDAIPKAKLVADLIRAGVPRTTDVSEPQHARPC